MNAIELKNIKKSFVDGAKEIEALKETNFSVAPGEFVAVIGPSGSGKSTFLTIIGGLQTPSNGKVLINGKDFYAGNEKSRANLRFEEIGFILQASNLIPFLTVSQQLTLIDKVKGSKKNKEVQNALFRDLGVENLITKYPSDLSGGERQRVAIAKALYNDPSVILADEPTASLDTEKAYDVVKILAKETKEKNKSTIMVTHDERMIKECDKIYQMNDGKLTLKK